MNPIRVLLADDHALMRKGFRTLLEGLGGVEVVAEADDGWKALLLLEQHRPDVAFVDISMPGLNGLEVAARVRDDLPEVRVIILSMHASEEYVLRAMRAGAAGYLLKSSDIAELDLALKAVARGETYLSPPISRALVDDYLRRSSGQELPLERLTPRQREVLQAVAEGSTTQQIALALNISPKTVETHRTQLMERLGIHNVPELVRFAVRVGLIRPDK